jgi:hypothetical protein
MESVLGFKLPAHEDDVRLSKDGYSFRLTSNVWRIGKDHVVNWELLDKKIDPKVKEGLVFTIGRMAEEVSPHHTYNCFLYFRKYFLEKGFYTGDKVSSSQILNMKSALLEEEEYKLGTIRAMLSNWVDWSYPGLEDRMGNFLLTLNLKGNFKGRAVLHSCPHTGPWTITEQQMLLNWAANAFSENVVSLQEFCWFLLCYQTARRPSQLISLRICDLRTEVEEGRQVFIIDMPRAKKRGEEGGFRKSFRSLVVTKDLFIVLLNLAESVQQMAMSEIPGLKMEDLRELPLFLHLGAFKEIGTVEEFRGALRREPAIFHMKNSQAFQLTKNLSRRCKAVSERTQDTIHFTPTRCRRTRATNLVRHGITGVQLAYLLDHEDTQNIGVYTEYTPELALRIFEKMNEAMSFLAAKFEGRIIAHEFEAARGIDPSSRRHKSGMKHVGNCAASTCEGGIKVCVSCNQFQPLLDADWDDLFLELSEEMDERRSSGASELVLQSYDLALAHVGAIMKACDKKRSQEIERGRDEHHPF